MSEHKLLKVNKEVLANEWVYLAKTIKEIRDNMTAALASDNMEEFNRLAEQYKIVNSRLVDANTNMGNVNDRVFLRKYNMLFNTDGNIHSYEMVSRNTHIESIEDLGKKTNAVCIVPIYIDKETGEKKFLVCKEFRYPLNDYCWEFPAGLVDEGESVEQAAARELKEETGLNVDEIVLALPGGFSSAGMTDERVAVVVMKVSGKIETCDGLEDINSYLMTFEEMQQLIKDEGKKCSCRMQCIIAGLSLAGL